jgi:hypothetical protein
MSSITTLFEEAQLAEAAYANFFDDSGNLITTNAQLITALTTGDMKFSIAQATDFTNRYQVVSQLPNTASGFSATVFLDTTTGQYTFAARGTEANAADLIGADLHGVVADGIAIDQVIDMYNYWQSLTHLGVYQAAYLDTSATNAVGSVVNDGVVQYVHMGNSDTVLVNTPLAWGTNELGGVATVDVTGHSLGGHLAMAFSRLFPSATADVVAVNGAGFYYANSNVDNLFAALGGAPGFDAGTISAH